MPTSCFPRVDKREECFPFGENAFGGYAKKRHRFTGKERDYGSSLCYFGARYYAPCLPVRSPNGARAGTFRFTSVDPLKHDYPYYTPYNYAGNKPISYVDKNGNQEDFPPLIKQKQDAVLNPDLNNLKTPDRNLNQTGTFRYQPGKLKPSDKPNVIPQLKAFSKFSLLPGMAPIIDIEDSYFKNDMPQRDIGLKHQNFVNSAVHAKNLENINKIQIPGSGLLFELGKGIQSIRVGIATGDARNQAVDIGSDISFNKQLAGQKNERFNFMRQTLTEIVKFSDQGLLTENGEGLSDDQIIGLTNFSMLMKYESSTNITGINDSVMKDLFDKVVEIKSKSLKPGLNNTMELDRPPNNIDVQ